MQLYRKLIRWRFYNLISKGVVKNKWDITALVGLVGPEKTREIITGVDDVKLTLNKIYLKPYWIDVVISKYIKDLIVYYKK